MKKSFIFCAAAYVVCIAVFVVFLFYFRIKNNDSAPVIFFESDEITVSVKDGNDVLLSGVSANDKEDGDVTGKIVIESMSTIDNGVRTVTYAAFDSVGHVTRGSRKLVYTDYSSPVFSLKAPLSFGTWDENSILKLIHAEDVFDGDITPRVSIESAVLIDSYKGIYEVTLSSYNSASDVVSVTLYANIAPRTNYVPTIELTDYIVYVDKGSAFVPESFVKNVVSGTQEKNLFPVITSNVDTSKEGNYIVSFAVSNEKGYEGLSFLTVVVR